MRRCWRSQRDRVEGHHHGAVVGLEETGAVAVARGPIHAPVFGRSTNKPLQAVGVLRAGAGLDDEEIALTSASHSGEPVHLAVVRRMLDGVGLDEAALGNTPGLPLSEAAAMPSCGQEAAPAPSRRTARASMPGCSPPVRRGAGRWMTTFAIRP